MWVQHTQIVKIAIVTLCTSPKPICKDVGKKRMYESSKTKFMVLNIINQTTVGVW